MPPPPPTLHVHYYRPQPSAHNWHLNLTPPNAAPLHTLPPHPLRTSFGHLFSTLLSPLPASLKLQPVHRSLPPDLPRLFIRRNPVTTTHIFLLQSHPTPYNTPVQIPHPSLPSHPRFLPLLVPPSLLNPCPPWLLLRHSSFSSELFPASPQYRPRDAPALYLLDQAAFKHPTAVSITPLYSYANDYALLSANPASTPGLTITLPVKHHVAFTLCPDSTWGQSPFPDVRALLIAQVDQLCGAVCPSLPAMIPRSIPPVDALPRTPAGTVLRIYAYRVSNGVGFISVSAFVAARGKALQVVREADGDGTADAFAVTIGTEDSVRVLMTVEGEKGQWGGQWDRSMGTEVACVQSFDRLLLVSEVERSVMYYRFGQLEDWHEWEMHVWSEGGDGWEGRTAMVKGERPLRDGMVRFDLVGLVFPKGAVVKAEMVRMSKLEGRIMVNELGEEYLGEPYIDASRRDVVREWVSGEEADEVMHFVQGERRIRSVGPSLAEMQARRWVRLRYYRYSKGDYDGWDLWTWDDSDPDFHRVVCAKIEESETHTWVEFEIDRAKYGTGSRVSIIPRRGGDEWLERDEPIRVWTSELMEGGQSESSIDGNSPGHAPIKPLRLGPCKTGEGREVAETNSVHRPRQHFLIAQANKSVMRGLSEAKSKLKAYVDSPHSISLVSQVPVSWMLTQQKGRSRTMQETELRVCGEQAHHILQTVADHGRIRGKLLRFSKVVEKSPIEYMLVFNEARVTFDEDFLVENVVISVPGFDSIPLTWETKENWDDYFYEGSLGWEYRKDKCSFRCFAPTAGQLSVVLYDSPTGDAGRKVIPMRRIPEGCWKIAVRGNLKGKFYKLLAEGENKRLFPGVEVIDPYSRCNTGHTGRGLIFGTENTPVHQRPDIAPEKTIVYELHVRDISIDKASGISQRGKFMGLTERGTSWRRDAKKEADTEACSLTDWKQSPMPISSEAMQTLDMFSSGLDHIVQMGVNAIQILPIQDFDNDESDESAYRWGYMPVHFNSPDGWYASSTTTVARVTEFKKLVDSAHRAGLKVIMDVVYNHTAEDSNEFNLEARFSFNGIAPRYYYRTCGNTPVAYTGDSTCGRREPHEPRCGECYSNGSGCGNEFRSESPMGRKFIIDSLKYWATEYKVDGFRFDLLGLIDVETLERASTELHKIDPNILIYGEPWAGGLSPIQLTEKGTQRSRGFGVFNNTFRDAIRGSPFGAEETFVMDGGRHSEVKGGIIGSIDDFCDKPIETVNYVECHDNYTLWDHMRFYIRSRTDDIAFSEGDMRRMHRLAAVIVFTSQGIPFIQAGQEMCRTKFDVENSYESPDSINMLRWETKQTEWATVQYYRGLILLRRSHPEIFCKKTSDEVHNSVVFYEDLGLPSPERCIAYRILGNPFELLASLRRRQDNQGEDAEEESRKWSEVVVLLNPTPSEQVFELPGANQDTVWIEFVDATHSGVRNLRCPIIGYVPVQGRSACLLRKASSKEQEDFRLVQRLAAVTDSYASFHGDNPLSNYAVGLTSTLETNEAEEQAELVAKRRNFEKNRTQRRDRHLYTPSPSVSEDDALRALQKAYGK